VFAARITANPSLTVGTINNSDRTNINPAGACSATTYTNACPGATAAADTALQMTIVLNSTGSTAPVPAARFIARITDDDASLPSSVNLGTPINVVSLSWTPCHVAAVNQPTTVPIAGTNVQAFQQTFTSNTLNTFLISRDIYVCGPGKSPANNPTAAVYWDVNENGTFDIGIDQVINAQSAINMP